MPMKLREYQTRAVEMTRNEIRKGNKRVMIVMPTGAGKTHILGDIASKAVEKGNKILAMMHRRQLVTQMVDRFSDTDIDCGIIMAGMDSELSKTVQVSTVQTYHRRLLLDEMMSNRFFIDAAVVMIDEAHHALSKTYQNILKHYPEKIIIGVTATPVLSSGIGMGEFFHAIVSPISVDALMKGGFLVPAVYYGPSTPDLSKVKTLAGDYHQGQLNDVMKQPKLIGDVVDNWLKLADNRKTMVFAVKVSHSKAIVEEFNRRGIQAEHLDAHHQDEERNDVLDRFRNGETRVLSNVALYTEGTDIPEIESIVLARPTKSLGFHLQMIGRGARPYPGKKDFMVLDHGGNIERLGFYEDEIEWSLDGKELGYRKKVIREKEKKILTCSGCTFQFTGPKCPQCGLPVKDYGKKIEAVDADLVEIGKNGGKRMTTEDKKRWFAMLEYERRMRGYKPGWSANQYRSKTGVWPRGMDDVIPMEPDQSVKNWLTYQRIKYIKGMKAAERKIEEKEQQSHLREMA